MAQKDMVEKLLEDHEDVFADIVNVLLFNGERVISERSLKENCMNKKETLLNTGLMAMHVSLFVD